MGVEPPRPPRNPNRFGHVVAPRQPEPQATRGWWILAVVMFGTIVALVATGRL